MVTGRLPDELELLEELEELELLVELDEFDVLELLLEPFELLIELFELLLDELELVPAPAPPPQFINIRQNSEETHNLTVQERGFLILGSIVACTYVVVTVRDRII